MIQVTRVRENVTKTAAGNGPGDTGERPGRQLLFTSVR